MVVVIAFVLIAVSAYKRRQAQYYSDLLISGPSGFSYGYDEPDVKFTGVNKLDGSQRDSTVEVQIHNGNTNNIISMVTIPTSDHHAAEHHTRLNENRRSLYKKVKPFGVKSDNRTFPHPNVQIQERNMFGFKPAMLPLLSDRYLTRIADPLDASIASDSNITNTTDATSTSEDNRISSRPPTATPTSSRLSLTAETEEPFMVA